MQIVRWAVDKNEMTLRYIFIYIYIYTNTHINVFKHLTKNNKLLSSTTVPSRTNNVVRQTGLLRYSHFFAAPNVTQLNFSIT